MKCKSNHKKSVLFSLVKTKEERQRDRERGEGGRVREREKETSKSKLATTVQKADYKKNQKNQGLVKDVAKKKKRKKSKINYINVRLRIKNKSKHSCRFTFKTRKYNSLILF